MSRRRQQQLHKNLVTCDELEPKLSIVDADGGQEPTVRDPEFHWHVEEAAMVKYSDLGSLLAFGGDLVRNTSSVGGLTQLLPSGNHTVIVKGSQLLPIIVDRIKLRVLRDGKTVGSKPDAADLNAMLASESFLGQFQEIDVFTRTPLFRSNFSLTKSGLNDGGPGDRIWYAGEDPVVSNSMEKINEFLSVMAFDTPADRTNTVAAALTTLLHNHWPGGKPIVLVTANKSHAGKDTIISFAAGEIERGTVSSIRLSSGPH